MGWERKRIWIGYALGARVVVYIEAAQWRSWRVGSSEESLERRTDMENDRRTAYATRSKLATTSNRRCSISGGQLPSTIVNVLLPGHELERVLSKSLLSIRHTGMFVLKFSTYLSSRDCRQQNPHEAAMAAPDAEPENSRQAYWPELEHLFMKVVGSDM